ncbi:MAG: aspartate--tRNA ligase [Rickettsiales bacterium]
MQEINKIKDDASIATHAKYNSKYRSHTCGELNFNHLNLNVNLSGWIARKRDHGNLLFIDLRDNFGITQLVLEGDLIEKSAKINLESVISVKGTVKKRDINAVNKDISTGEIEVHIVDLQIESFAEYVPFEIHGTTKIPEDLRLEYRFLDLRREKLHNNVLLRSNIINELRKNMQNAGFFEFQTPILTSSSPEGARDFLVPSRLNPGKFYALPQAPQQFKQLLMVAGFDRYFQIAPCFRDEDARADRSPGEFYQLDIEMSFVEQEDIFATIEPIIFNVFKKFSNKKINSPFKRISYDYAMLHYGSDKPDLRNPLLIQDTTKIFKDSDFTIFANLIANGSSVHSISAPCEDKSRSFFDNLTKFAQSCGLQGLAYIQINQDLTVKGPIAKFLNEEQIKELIKIHNATPGDAIFFIATKSDEINKIAGKIRTQIAEELNLIDKDLFEFVWVYDFPFFELTEEGKIDFSHNPFSMPQCSLEHLQKLHKENNIDELLKLKAFQYDIVCNGIELSSGAIRNHKLDMLYEAFAIVGYSKESVDEQFKNMVNAFKYGAPPHGGIAPGIDRMVMLISDELNIREVIAFPLNQNGKDLMMNAPSHVTEKHLKELGINIRK